MKHSATKLAADKACPCVFTDESINFYPNHNADFDVIAADAFNQYVKCRWPIHVFAVDPVTQDQNVSDSLTRKREMQFALTVAFSQGLISGTSMTEFQRKLSLEIDTIALNRTVVGFSHGQNTFGWRFYPRVQTPPTPNNIKVGLNLILGGPSRDADLKTRMIEPGQRECVALVVMPAFVPYVDVDVRSNWFRLTNPRKKEFNLRDSVELGRKIQSMRYAREACAKDAHQYRQGTTWRLMKAVDQLEERLPLQSQHVQIAVENNLGGFQMLSNTVSQLGPELIGFYGQPGIDAKEATTLFLVGKNFSVHDTQVIFGGRGAAVDSEKAVLVKLMSREVMMVTIPAGTMHCTTKGKPVVHVHVATPYGVTPKIEIPLINSAAAAVTKHEAAHHAVSFGWKKTPANLASVVRFDGLSVTVFDFKPATVSTKLTVSEAGTAPFKQLSLGNKAELAFFVTVRPKLPLKDPIRFAVGKFDLEFKKREAGIELFLPTAAAKKAKAPAPTEPARTNAEPKETLRQAILRNMKVKVPNDFDAKDLVLDGFIRFKNSELPIMRLQNIQIIKIDWVKK